MLPGVGAKHCQNCNPYDPAQNSTPLQLIAITFGQFRVPNQRNSTLNDICLTFWRERHPSLSIPSKCSPGSMASGCI